MKTIVRANDEAVSPVIATILMVAITVVLAAVLYVMVSGLISTPTQPGTGWGFNLGTSGNGANWVVSFTTVPASATQAGVSVIVKNAAGATVVNGLTLAYIQAQTSNTTQGLTFKPLKNDGTVVAGDSLLLSVSTYPTGSQITLVAGGTQIYQHNLA